MGMPPKNQPFTTDIKRRRNSLSSRRHFDKLSLQQLPDVETTKDLGIDDIYIRLFLAGNLKLNIYSCQTDLFRFDWWVKEYNLDCDKNYRNKKDEANSDSYSNVVNEHLQNRHSIYVYYQCKKTSFYWCILQINCTAVQLIWKQYAGHVQDPVKVIMIYLLDLSCFDQKKEEEHICLYFYISSL